MHFGAGVGKDTTDSVRKCIEAEGWNPLPWRHGLKGLVVADLDQQFLLSQRARRGPWNDGANLPAMVEAASHPTPSSTARGITLISVSGSAPRA